MLGRVKTLAMLVGSFLFTFGVLALAWMTLVGGGQLGLGADPPLKTVPSMTPPPSSPHKTQMPSEQPTVKPGKPTPSVQPSPTPDPSAPPSAAPSLSAAPSTGPATTQTYVLVGGAYTSVEIPDGGSVTPSGDGVSIVTGPNATDPLRVTYSLDPSELPTGTHVTAVAVRVCGEATGANYEIDGPLGLTQSIRIGIPPEGDGCWHLDAQAPTDLSVTVSASTGTQMVIGSVEYEVTFAR